MLRAYDHRIKIVMNCVVVHHFQKTPHVSFGVSFAFAAPLDSSKKCALNQTASLETPPKEITSIIYISMILYICIKNGTFPLGEVESRNQNFSAVMPAEDPPSPGGWRGGRPFQGSLNYPLGGDQTFKHTVILRDFTCNNTLSGLIT